MEDWSEIILTVKAQELDTASSIAMMAVPYGIYVEDYRDLESQVEQIAHINLIDEDLLHKDRTHAKIHLYVNPEENPHEALSFLKERLESEQIAYEVSLTSLKEEDWAFGWKKYYHPLNIGKRLTVCPTWEEYTPRAGEVVVRLDPGMAFGTGTHETTQLCIRSLERYLKSGDRLLDLGCGSGILAISAILLGAQSASGVDIDKNAVKVARENAVINGIPEEQLALYAGDIIGNQGLKEKLGLHAYDLITANIVADVILAFQDTFAQFLKPSGILITSGIIEPRRDEVETALKKAGFTVKEVLEQGDWISIVASV